MTLSLRFTLYRGDTPIHAEVACETWEQLKKNLAAMEEQGYRLSPAGKPGALEEGEDRWTVTGYVVGTAAKRGGGTQPVVWLYTGNGNYKHCSVYEENFESLWFQPVLTNPWPAAAAPTRPEAESKGFMRDVTPREVIRKPKIGKDGEPFKVYDRWVGDPVAASQSPSPPAPAQPHNGEPNPAELAKLLAAWIRKAQSVETLENLIVKIRKRKVDVSEVDWAMVKLALRQKLAELSDTSDSAAFRELLHHDYTKAILGDDWIRCKESLDVSEVAYEDPFPK